MDGAGWIRRRNKVDIFEPPFREEMYHFYAVGADVRASRPGGGDNWHQVPADFVYRVPCFFHRNILQLIRLVGFKIQRPSLVLTGGVLGSSPVCLVS